MAIPKWTDRRCSLVFSSLFHSVTSLDLQTAKNNCCYGVYDFIVDSSRNKPLQCLERSLGMKNQPCTSFLGKTTRYKFKDRIKTYMLIILQW